MLYPELAAQIVESIPGVTPHFATRGERKGQHADKAYRFTIPGREIKHLAIVRKPTKEGVTLYVNLLSVEGQPYPDDLADAQVTQRYRKGFIGRTGDMGLSSTAAQLPTLLPKDNNVLRLSVRSEAGMRALLEWYRGATFRKSAGRPDDEDAQAGQPGHHAQMPEEGRYEHLENEYVQRAIRARRGQAVFREALMTAYDARCAVSGCRIAEVLEAAHIRSHAEGGDYQTSNGILLRADIHTLFDLHLLAIDGHGAVRVSPMLGGSEYSGYEGQAIHLPANQADRPSSSSLAERMRMLRKAG